ncbi:MAG TPA: UvrD-helicase domain-containing protein [Spirochaetia bacterium]|nr:UvrD-helicase domain-containing protein [Spirochaetia bacterium]
MREPTEDSPLAPSGALDERLERLLALAGTDEGFFVLALHSFIEAWAADALPAGASDSFPEIIRQYADHLRAQGRPQAELRVFRRIVQEHAVTNKVRHSFARLDREEALAAIHNFLEFCAACRIGSSALEKFRRSLDLWDEKRSPRETSQELARIRVELIAAQKDNRKLLGQTEAWARDKLRLAELDGEALRLSAELEREKARATAKAARLDELRRDLNALVMEKKKLAEQLSAYRDLDQYVDHVSRFSLYTRTRMDYERSVMKLTPEQSEALEGIRPGHDFLIRGGAGTGKTIVLLHALARVRRERRGELELRPGRRTLFLTYTTTLVKYDRYVAEILKEAGTDDLIVTADSFFLSRLKSLGQRQRVDYGVIPRLADKLNTTTFFTAAELAVEVEDFIFGNLVTRREYVEEKIPRRGMRQPLTAVQREAVWGVRDSMAAEMEHDGVLSKNYSRIKMIEFLEQHPGDGRLADLDVAFVDESQDLSAADLRALKLMTSRGLVMAGDTGQSIYGLSSPYKRAGVDISGRSRVLHTSFRCTVPIRDVTEAYRRLSGLEDEEAEATAAFRDGPVPELYTASGREELARLLLRKAALFIERLSYDPENIAVLAPTKTDLAFIGDMLGHAGYHYANVRDDDFSFKQEKTIRLSSLHSSKGLDFAVVLLYLPSLPPRTEYDERAGETLVRNLIYVAMTRAMDNLNVFTLEGAHEGQRDEPLQDLVRVFRQYQAEKGP